MRLYSSKFHVFSRTLAGSLALSVFLGCGQQQVAAPVDTALARQTLEAVLSDWRDGGTPAAWNTRSPQVVVQDSDWINGEKLEEFEILGSGDARDANLFCKVRLTLATTNQTKLPRVVTYCVGTSPVITVFRNTMP